MGPYITLYMYLEYSNFFLIKHFACAGVDNHIVCDIVKKVTQSRVDAISWWLTREAYLLPQRLGDTMKRPERANKEDSLCGFMTLASLA